VVNMGDNAEIADVIQGCHAEVRLSRSIRRRSTISVFVVSQCGDALTSASAGIRAQLASPRPA
jgi:hypothetical protein